MDHIHKRRILSFPILWTIVSPNKLLLPRAAEDRNLPTLFGFQLHPTGLLFEVRSFSKDSVKENGKLPPYKKDGSLIWALMPFREILGDPSVQGI